LLLLLFGLAAVQVKLVGKQRLVLDLSCRQRDGQYYVVTDRWQRFSSLSLSASSLATLADSCDEFLVHGVDVEGMQLGIDDQLVELLGEWSPIPVTYAGGARTLVGERNGNRGKDTGQRSRLRGERGVPGGTPKARH
jgi:phosphoribosylformimino-5-aminoimidazole carboxamide ribonucleotide (ProFAR) isomerase